MKRSQESKPQLLTNYSEIMPHLQKQSFEDLEKEKALHQQLIDSRVEKQRKFLLEKLKQEQSKKLRNILK